MIFRARKKNFLLVNGLGLYLCLFVTILVWVLDKKMKTELRGEEITDALVTAYQAPANAQALKKLLAANEENKTLIRNGFNFGFYVFLFITLIFIANLILLIKVIKTEEKSLDQPDAANERRQ